MIRQMISIRGATTVPDNTEESIRKYSVELMREIIERNGLNRDGLQIVHYIIGTTADITAFYPARAIRESGMTAAPVFSCQEPAIENALPLCIRLLVEVSNSTETDIEAAHVYLHGAKTLRKDLVTDEHSH